MTAYFITRHAGAKEWAQRQGIQAEFREHLDDPNLIGRGDLVYGTLPLHLISTVMERDARYFHLDMDLAVGDRGQPLSADEMERRNAKLVEYHAFRGHPWPPALSGSAAPAEPSSKEPKPVAKSVGQARVKFRRLRIVSCLASLIFLIALSTHLAAEGVRDFLFHLLAPSGAAHDFHPGRLAAIILVSLVVFVGASQYLYRNRHRVIEHGAQITSDPEESARSVLIMGLSPVGERQKEATACLKSLLQDGVTTLDRLTLPAPALSVDPGIGQYAKLLKDAPWLQNLRALWYHRDKIELVLVVASKQTRAQFDDFKALVALAQASATELAGRPIRIVLAGEDGVDFEDYNAVQRLMDRAFAKAKAERKKYKDDDICVDVTSGTKTFSIAAAASTFGPKRHFMYVNFDGIARSYNAEMRWAHELQVE